jgi:hypothetical protein
MKLGSAAISCGRIELPIGLPPFDELKVHASTCFSVKFSVFSSGVVIVSSVCVHHELFEIFVCFAAVSKLALMSWAVTFRPFAGALSWKNDSPMTTVKWVASCCSMLVARKFSRMPVSSGVYQRWSKTVKPQSSPLSRPP